MNQLPAFTLENPVGQITYDCYERLGTGGFGEVWGGISSLGASIAVKLWRPTSNPMRDLVNWFNEQNICLQCWAHPYIITSYDQFITREGFLVIVMERAHGSLEGLVAAQGPFNPWSVASVGIQLTFALDHIHQMNVIHRDVTVRNVLWFADGVVKLADFGISKQLPSGEEFARTLIGFPGVVPPELLKYGRSTTQSDIYQLGLVLLHLLLGYSPIALHLDQDALLAQITTGIPRQLAEQLIPVHGQLATIIAKMLRRHEEYRHQTPAEVRVELSAELSRLSQPDLLQTQVAQFSPGGGVPPMFKRRR